MTPLETYGNYQLVEKLAVGGMAQLFLAKRLKPKDQQRTVVLKRILPHLAEDTAFVTMFLDEARIAARLHHPNVIEILDLGAEGDSYFIAMEYIHGEDLRRISKRGLELSRRMPPPLVCRVVAQACRGLDYAHRRTDATGKPLRIVHRDVSPQNILVGFDGTVKVVDFGIAKAADKATVTASGVIKGKHAYMSPEQALGRDIDHRTDVFALGIVLYETLTATRLFRRATDLQTLKAVSECRVDAPSRVFPGVPPPLDTIIMKALSKDLGVRFQAAAELGQALEEWLGDRPDGTLDALGTFVSELFADRLDRESREGKFVPTKSAIDFGSGSRSGSNKSGATASLRVPVVDAKKTLLDANRNPASPLESRTTDVTPAYLPPDRSTDRVPVASSSTELAQPALDRPMLEVLPEPGGTTPYGSPLPSGGTALYGIFDVADEPEPKTLINPLDQRTLIEPGQPQPIINPLDQKTLIEPAMRVAMPTSPPLDFSEVQTVSSPGELLPAKRPSGERARISKPRLAQVPDTRGGLRWPWWAAAAITTVAVAAVVAKVLVDRRDLFTGRAAVAESAPRSPSPSVDAGPALQASPEVVPDKAEGGGKPLADAAAPVAEHQAMSPFGSVPVTAATHTLVRKQGQLYAQLSGQGGLKAGDPVRLVGPPRGGTKERDFYGVASVVEVKENEARLIFEDPEALPDGLFVTAEEDKLSVPQTKQPLPPQTKPVLVVGLTLVGTLQLKHGDTAADVALKNATDFDWNGCEVRLPDNRAIKLGAAVVIQSGETQWMSGAAFKTRAQGPDAKMRDGFAFVKCKEGDGYLKAAYLP